MAKKQNTTNNTTEAAEAPKVNWYTKASNNFKAAVLAGISAAAKALTIIDVTARIVLGVSVWFVHVPQYMTYAATFLGVVGLLQVIHMLWKAQASTK